MSDGHFERKHERGTTDVMVWLMVGFGLFVACIAVWRDILAVGLS